MSYIGVDIGGTKCAVVKGDSNGNITDKIRFDTTTPEETLDNIKKAVSRMGDAKAIGISCGGPLDSAKGIIMSPPNLPGWDNVHITKIFEQEFGISTFLRNDADACALAEWKFGAGKGCNNMIFLTFGTGMGAGLILNGMLYSGSNDCAGEIGHVRMSDSGPVGYGKEGSFEGFCSGGGIAQLGANHARAMLQRGEIPSYCNSPDKLGQISAKDIADCANRGESDAIEVFERCGTMLGRGLSILIDVLNPQKIVIGSVFARCENLLRSSMQRVIDAECIPSASRNCEVVPAGLGESIGDVAAVSVAVDGFQKTGGIL